MPNGKSDVMAQAVYLAQLEAARGTCKCKTCRILRKAATMMTDQFLSPGSANPAGIKDVIESVKAQTTETFSLGEGDE
jgi:hypothetical protein